MNSTVVDHDSNSVRGPPTETTPLLSRSVPLTISESSLNISSPNLETQIGFLSPGLRPSESRLSSACIKGQKATTPLPRAQLVTLCLVRIVIPTAFSQIFLYINEFIAFLNVTGDPSEIGIFSELVYKYAEPHLFLHPPGFFGATSSVVHTVLGEITDSTNQAAAFPLYRVTGPVGSIIGPLVGGSLLNPAQKYPIFNTLLFSLHPYFLPCLMSGIISLMGVALAYFFLDESLPHQEKLFLPR
ncbi:hypothetical protein BDP27DRAFT_1430220 [Rhodocollybia butyracea]|uniref:Uncharacterized protein n=1 Tax=Rhodocollybia butyracea TaxID=206335 RepID=A0A9P5TYC2_9AGAR|nr:hypothetical protein BDP27DRAFT_1430220 [Rhodocollybia butyracea]